MPSHLALTSELGRSQPRSRDPFLDIPLQISMNVRLGDLIIVSRSAIIYQEASLVVVILDTLSILMAEHAQVNIS